MRLCTKRVSRNRATFEFPEKQHDVRVNPIHLSCAASTSNPRSSRSYFIPGTLSSFSHSSSPLLNSNDTNMLACEPLASQTGEEYRDNWSSPLLHSHCTVIGQLKKYNRGRVIGTCLIASSIWDDVHPNAVQTL